VESFRFFFGFFGNDKEFSGESFFALCSENFFLFFTIKFLPVILQFQSVTDEKRVITVCTIETG